MDKKRVIVLGIGSPYGADTLGWDAVGALAQGGLAVLFPRLELRFAQSDRPGSRLLNLLQGADAAILIDAMRAGRPAGYVQRFAADELTAESGLLSTHGFGVADALALGRTLGGLPGEIVIVGIEMARDEQKLAEASLTVLTELVRRELEQFTV